MQLTLKQKICYIAHPIGGNVEANLAAIRAIVHKINTDAKYAHIVPFVPYYADVVSMDDNNPTQRQRGLANGQSVLSRRGAVDELWLFGPYITPGMQQEIFTAFTAKIPVIVKNKQLYEPVTQLAAEWILQQQQPQQPHQN